MNRRLFLKAAASIAFPVAFMPCSVEPLSLAPLSGAGPEEGGTWTLDRLDFIAQFGEPMRMPPHWKTLWRPWPDGFICSAQSAVGNPFIRSENWPSVEIRTGSSGMVIDCLTFIQEVDIHAGETLQLPKCAAYYMRGSREYHFYGMNEGLSGFPF